MDKPITYALSAAVAAILVWNVCGGTAPFRDAGEFAVAAQHLTIAHPPGYPFYTLLGKLWVTLIPFGNVAYRLNVLSALALAGAFGLMIFWMRRCYGVGLAVSALVAMLIASCRLLLNHAFVSEMFSLGLLFLMALLVLTEESCFDPRRLLLAAFLLPLGLGTRLDLAFAAVYALGFMPLWIQSSYRRFLLVSLAFFALGLTVFLYLPVRSSAWPLVNWGDPSNWDRLIGSLLRRSHGSTVDLISRSYKSGELFWDGAWHWLKVYWEAFGPLTLAAPLGLFALGRTGRILPSLLCWFFTGPVFIWMANMPPNPHAIKILEDHFLPSLVMGALWIALGLEWLRQKILQFRHSREGGNPVHKIGMFWIPAFAGMTKTVLLYLPLLVFFFWRSMGWSLRRDFYAYDYFVNVSRSAPPGSIVVLHEDVQLFSSWEAILNRSRRPDLRLVAQGLSGSLWYQRCLRDRWGFGNLVLSGKLENPAAWENLVAVNSGASVLAGFETESGSPALRKIPHGLLSRLCLASDENCPQEAATGPWPALAMRGRYRQDEEKYFFDQDLIEDYGRASFELGNALLRQGRREEGLSFLKKSLVLRPLMAQAAVLLAFDAFSRSSWDESLVWWVRSREKLDALLELARRYRSLPDVVRPMRKDLGYVLTSMAVTKERMGAKWDEIISLHQESIRHDPDNPLSHYNLAATYWRAQDLQGARREFETVLRLDPNHNEARQFLSRLAAP